MRPGMLIVLGFLWIRNRFCETLDQFDEIYVSQQQNQSETLTKYGSQCETIFETSLKTMKYVKRLSPEHQAMCKPNSIELTV